MTSSLSPLRRPGTRRAIPVVALALLMLLTLGAAPASAGRPADPPGAGRAADPARTATVMTRNLYLGASLDGIIDALTDLATDPDDPDKAAAVVVAATQTWQTVQASHPAERMAAVADEIVRAKPAAVGLQEVTRWSTYAYDPQGRQVVGDPTVVYDFLELLLDALEARGVTYTEVRGATASNFTSDPIPVLTGAPFPTQAVQLLDRDVIIVREGVKATNAHNGNFQTVLAPPLAPIRVDRGWGSADLRTRLATFRFVNSHTEAFGPEALRIGEVQELFAAQDAITAATRALPTVYVGDYNSDAPTGGAYQLLRSRLSDLWLDTHAAGPDPNPASATCCFGAFLNDPDNPLETRIDLLLGTAGVRALSTYRIGDVPVDLPGDTWWASDHAGVVGKVVIGR